MDVTLAAVAAIELGEVSAGRQMEVTFGVSTTIEGEDDRSPCIHTGALLGVRVREIEDGR
jgi:hypothetical protein